MAPIHRNLLLYAALGSIALGCGREEPPPPAQEPAVEELPAIAAVQKEEGKLDGMGRYRGTRTHQYDSGLSEDQRALVEQLEAIGYATGSRPGHGLTGVTIHDHDRAEAGLNLFTSGHGQVALLADMDGHVLHEWRADFWSIWPDFPVARTRTGTQYLRHVHMFDNGDLLAVYEGMGIVKLDRESNVLWASPCRAHHDLEVQPDGTVYTLTREAHLVPRVDPVLPVLEDFVTVLDAEGREVRRVSVLECFERAPEVVGEWKELWKANTEAEGDMFHANAVRVLNGSLADRNPAFSRGDVLFSSHTLDALFVVDMEREAVVWIGRGDFRRQHDPRVLPSGRLLLFDNRGMRTRSRVLELDVGTMEIAWEYAGSADHPFYSHTCGVAQRLPGGNTLITESDNGRAFEVTPDGTIVWEYYNPHRAGAQGEFIASLVEMERLALDSPIDWLNPAGS